MDSTSITSKRKPNFTESENMFLVQAFEQHRAILNSKLTSVKTNRGKQHVWEEICMGFNTLNNDQGKGERTVKEIRRKWKNMVTSAKRHAKQLKKTSKEPNGRFLKPLSALSQKIIEMKTEASNAEDDNAIVIVEIKTEHQGDGYCTESISKKGPLEVFYSSDADAAAAVVPQGSSSPSSSGEASFTAEKQMHTNKSCEIKSYEIDDDERVATEPSGVKRVSVNTDSAQRRKVSKTAHTTTHIQCELSELKREKLLLQIEKLKSEKDKLEMEKERLGLEIQFWKKKLESTPESTQPETQPNM